VAPDPEDPDVFELPGSESGSVSQWKLKQLVLVVNFLFGLRVNEIPNKTLILDFRRPFLCSVPV
jgi:hypothetical protein